LRPAAIAADEGTFFGKASVASSHRSNVVRSLLNLVKIEVRCFYKVFWNVGGVDACGDGFERDGIGWIFVGVVEGAARISKRDSQTVLAL